MYQARLHPEQYSNTFSNAQVKRLHDAMMTVCDTAVANLAESDRFPKDWLMKHRWGKGKKDGGKLPTGEKIIFLKVGGRTSAVVPSVQKKTGAVAGDLSGSGVGSDEDEAPKLKAKKTGRRGSKAINYEEEDDESEEKLPVSTKRGRGGKRTRPPVKEGGGGEQGEKEEEEGEGEGGSEAGSEKTSRAKRQRTSTGAALRKKVSTPKEKEPEAVNGQRRSSRATRR